MSQISKCPKVTVVLTYWEASGDVSELRYKSLLYFSSKRSYWTNYVNVDSPNLGFTYLIKLFRGGTVKKNLV